MLLRDRAKALVGRRDLVIGKQPWCLEQKLGLFRQDEVRPAEARKDVTGGIGRRLQCVDEVEGFIDVDWTVASPHLAVAGIRPRVRISTEFVIQSRKPAVRLECFYRERPLGRATKLPDGGRLPTFCFFHRM